MIRCIYQKASDGLYTKGDNEVDIVLLACSTGNNLIANWEKSEDWLLHATWTALSVGSWNAVLQPGLLP